MVVAADEGTMSKFMTLPLLFGLVACHSGMDDMNNMRSYVADTRRETNRHLDAAQAAPSMDDMRGEMDHHRNGMTPMMADIEMTMDSMAMHCDGLGLGEMQAMHGELDGEMTRHLSAMEATADLGVAVGEVERHAATMFTMMDGMDGAMGHMTCQ